MQMRGDFGELAMETEQIEVTSALPQPNQNWHYIDRQGHEHYWRDGYPTLVGVVDETYWCADCGEDHTDSHWGCATCGEEITPGTYVDTSRRFVPGLTSFTLNGEPITQERFEELRRDWLENVRNA